MIGLGTLINCVAILLGGIIGQFAGKLFNENLSDSLTKACGISVMFISIASAMQGMLRIENNTLTTVNSMLVVICIALGALIGELCKIEYGIEKFGEWLKKKSGNSGDVKFVEGFVTASLTVCVGAMAIVGSIQDGISGDFTTLAIKSILDFVIIVVMTTSMGRGCAFSVIPVFFFEGIITLLGKFISPILTDTAISNISLVGAVLIFGVGINIFFGKKIRIANFLPAVLLAAIVAYLPITL